MTKVSILNSAFQVRFMKVPFGAKKNTTEIVCVWCFFKYNKALTGNLWIITRLLIFVPVVLIISYARSFALKLGYSQVNLIDVPNRCG